MKKLNKADMAQLDKLIQGASEEQLDSLLNFDMGAVTQTLDERGKRYGDFTDHARVAQQLQDVLRNHAVPSDPFEGFEHKWNHLSAVQKQALTVICDKLARIISGDPNYADNWHDIQGYAKLVEDRLPVAPETAPE